MNMMNNLFLLVMTLTLVISTSGCGNPGVLCSELSRRKCRQYSGCHYHKSTRSCRAAYRGGSLRCNGSSDYIYGTYDEDWGDDYSEYEQYDDNYDTYQDYSIQNK
eukprot:CCRYP_003233-RA/>CCRYP_003233-RA protein AED:0.02 eAED:0.02 QI:102/1/1/1/1/1/2/1212/104